MYKNLIIFSPSLLYLYHHQNSSMAGGWLDSPYHPQNKQNKTLFLFHVDNGGRAAGERAAVDDLSLDQSLPPPATAMN